MSISHPLRNVVLVGGAGNLGCIILAALQEAKIFQITVLTRPTSTASFPADVAVARSPYTEDDLVKVFQGQDAVISAVGAAGFQEQKVLVDAAVRAGVKRFLPSEFSLSTLDDATRRLVPVFEQKKMILDHLKEQEVHGLTWTGLAVGPLLDWGLQVGFLGFDLANKKATIWDGGVRSFAATNREELGKTIVAILKLPSETANQYLQISTVVTTQASILSAVEAATGEKWTVEAVQTEKQIETGRQLVSNGDFSGMFLLVQAAAYGKVAGVGGVAEGNANSILGLPVEGSLDATVAKELRALV